MLCNLKFVSAVVACAALSVAPTSLLAQRSSNAAVYKTVLKAHGLRKLDSYEFDAKPRCPEQARSPRCSAHAQVTVAAVRTLLKNGHPQRGHSFKLSPVRDSGSIRIVELVTSVDSISPKYGSASLFRYELDKDGKRVVGKKEGPHDTFVRSPTN